jgi:thiol-disulfide isomerase/thioredoxin
MKKTIFFALLSLVPLFSWGHIRSHIGVGSSYFYYTAAYFLLGWARDWVGQPSWRHHLIALVPLAWLSGFIMFEEFEIYFPVYTPLLFIVGLLGYMAGWYLSNQRRVALALAAFALATISIWRYHLPTIQYDRDANFFKKEFYPQFVGLKPELSFEDVNGNILGQEKFEGKVVVLDFWYSGCGYCIVKFRHLNQVAQHFKNDPRVLIASVVDGNLDSREKFKSMLVKYPQVTKPALYDPQGHFVNRYGIAKNGYSFEIDLDHKGTVFAVYGGTDGSLTEQLYIDRLISEIEDKLKTMPK